MTPDRIEHYIRTALILLTFIVLGAIWLFADLAPEVRFRVEGVLFVIMPAALDAVQVAYRRLKAPPTS